MSLQGVRDSRTDVAALLAIQEILDGKEWSADTPAEIADVLTHAGYYVGSPDETEDSPEPESIAASNDRFEHAVRADYLARKLADRAITLRDSRTEG